MITFLLNTLIVVLCVAGIFCTLLGLLTVVHWVKPGKEPMDSSNRIGKIAAWWIGLTRPEVLGECYKYFRQDVMDNVKDVDKADGI